MEKMVGQSIGRYHIIEKLGEGGMATVYKAYDTHLECEVAVKVIRTENILPSMLEHALQRFDREAKSVAKLNHPNIVSVTDYGNHEGKPFLVMPYLRGGTFKGLLQQSKCMDWKRALEMILPVADALAYAHANNIIHRDVKPSNILLTQTGQPMLTDFGVAKIIDNEETLDLTGTMATVGTPEYMAPEQVSSKTIDARADIYALGVVLYEMVTGRRPFEADTPMAVMIMHSRDPLPRPATVNPSLPVEIDYLLIKALAKNPSDRFQSMDEFHQAIEKLLGVEGFQPPTLPISTQSLTIDPLQTSDEQLSAITNMQAVPPPPFIPACNPLPQQPTRKPAKKGFLFVLGGVGVIALILIVVGMLIRNGPFNHPGGTMTGMTAEDGETAISTPLGLDVGGNKPISTSTVQSQPMITPALYSVSGCNISSHIHVGDLVYVTEGEGYNGVRTTPDDTVSNVFAKAFGGDALLVTDGPVCDRVDYLHWYVEPMFSSDWEEGGWTPEVAKSEGEYWLTPYPYWQPCGNSSISHLRAGDRAYVTVRGDSANRVRESAGLSAEIVGTIDPGGRMTVTAGPKCVDSFIWWEVSGDNGVSGWTAEGKGSDFWLIPVLDQNN